MSGHSSKEQARSHPCDFDTASKSAQPHHNNDAVQINKVIRPSITKATLVAAVLITLASCRLELSMRIIK